MAQRDLPSVTQLAQELGEVVEIGLNLEALAAAADRIPGLLSLANTAQNRDLEDRVAHMIDLMRQTWARVSASPNGEVAAVVSRGAAYQRS